MVDVNAVEVVAADGVELEAEVAQADEARVARAPVVAVLSHPHPLYGGDMRTPLIETLFRALPQTGISALRYNFRGAGRSGGEHDGGNAERLDAAAAFGAALAGEPEASAEEFDCEGRSRCKVVSVGWSFGADVSLAAAHDALAGWVAIAAPLAIVAPDEMTAPQDERPKLLLVPEHDQYRSPADAAELTAGWPNTRLQIIRGADHFLFGYEQQVAELVTAFIAEL